MKKTLKTIIATVLALTIAFCSIPAFAFQYGEKVEWIDERHTYADLYAYSGEMSDGTFYYEAYERANCCKLNLENEGFYLFSYDPEKVTEIEISSLINDGCPQGWADVLYSVDEGKALAYITGEEAYFGFEVAEGVPGAEISATYYESDISDIEFEDGVFDELIFAADFRLTEKDNVVEMTLDAEITFENGEVFTVERGDFIIEADEAIGRGRYDVTVNYCGYGENAELDVRLVTDYIEKVEIENIEDYLYVTEYYNGEWISGFASEAFENEKVTITFCDGTKHVIEEHYVYDYYGLPNGRFYEMWFLVEESGGEFTFVFEIAGQVLVAEKCEYKKAPFCQNAKQLLSYVELQTGWIIYWFKETVNNVMTGRESAFSLITFFSHEGVRSSLGYIFEAMSAFRDYYAK